MTGHRRGFSLLELALTLGLVGLILGVMLQVKDVSSSKACYEATKVQLEEVREAIERFAVANDRFPMPSRRNVGVESPVYGRESVPAQLDVVNGAVFGALPFQALGLPVDKAADCWGNKLTYIVTQDLTNPARFMVATTPGRLSINSSSSVQFLAEAGYALISHGADQLGAVKNNYSAATNDAATRRWCAANPQQIRTQNCDVVNTVLMEAQLNDGKDGAQHFFDDLIVYRGKPWRAGQVRVDGACNVPSRDCITGVREDYTAHPCPSGNGITAGYSWRCVGSGGGTTVNCSAPGSTPCSGCSGSETGTRTQYCTSAADMSSAPNNAGQLCLNPTHTGNIFTDKRCGSSQPGNCNPPCTQANGQPGIHWQRYYFQCYCW